MQNHLEGTKHATAVEKVDSATSSRSALISRKRGRPTRSVSSAVSQPSLHSWFRHSGSEGHVSESLNYDESFLRLLCVGVIGKRIVHNLGMFIP